MLASRQDGLILLMARSMLPEFSIPSQITLSKCLLSMKCGVSICWVKYIRICYSYMFYVIELSLCLMQCHFLLSFQGVTYTLCWVLKFSKKHNRCDLGFHGASTPLFLILYLLHCKMWIFFPMSMQKGGQFYNYHCSNFQLSFNCLPSCLFNHL